MSPLCHRQAGPGDLTHETGISVAIGYAGSFGRETRFGACVRRGVGMNAHAFTDLVPNGLAKVAPRSGRYLTSGSMISANAVRARLSRDLTVPRFTPVMSAISSYDLPSSSRSTNTSR